MCGVLLITCSSVNVCKEHTLLHLGASVVLVVCFFRFLKGFFEIHYTDHRHVQMSHV